MIIEERTYDLAPGRLPAYVALVQEEGIAIQRPILGRLIGYFHTELGPLNQIVHLWAYESFRDRAERRARLAADPHWNEYAAKVRGFSLRQQSRIFLPMSFSPLPELSADDPQAH
jgi:NIPSNAP